MAAITITATSVVLSATPTTFATQVTLANAGAAITAGQALYLDASGLWQLADCDAAAPANRCDGIALNGGATGQPIKAITAGPVTIGGTMTKGAEYYLGPVAGDIGPFADVLSGDGLVKLGWAYSTTVLIVSIVHTGITI